MTDLYFFKSSDSYGFTAASISSFREMSSFAIVRELIQNSLDAAAALHYTGVREARAIVRFSTTEVKTEDIPGIESYKSAFKKAVKRREEENNGSLNDQEQIVADRISEALSQDWQQALIVSDNGIGLDKDRMTALLSDGRSRKESGASGTFGVGHFSLFPASDLRYVLYGGICNGKRIASGHAILASHYANQSDDTGRSANGYYLVDRKKREYIYPWGNDLPILIKNALADIEKDSGHGTAVIVPAFNRFRSKDKDFLSDTVPEAIACSFFVAIADGQLEVVIEGEGNKPQRELTSEQLQTVLEKYREQKRKKDYLPGEQAFFAYQAYRGGYRHEVEVLDGSVRLFVQHPAPSGRTRVNLCRNGMWITGNIPGFNFADYEAFEGLVLVSAKSAPRRFHDLIGKAEGPLHNRLDKKAISNEDWKQLRQAFNVIKKKIEEVIPKLTSDEYSPDDFLVFPDSTAGSRQGKKAGREYQGTIALIKRRISSRRPHETGPGGTTGGRNKGRSKNTGKRRQSSRSGSRERPTLPQYFKIVVTPSASNRRKIRIHCIEPCEDLELRLVVDDHSDVTTERIWTDRVAAITAAKVNGKTIQPDRIITKPYPAILLGNLGKNTTTEVEAEYKLAADGVPIQSGASLRVEIGKRPSDDTKPTISTSE